MAKASFLHKFIYKIKHVEMLYVEYLFIEYSQNKVSENLVAASELNIFSRSIIKNFIIN